MAAKEIITSPHGQPHQPVLERGFAAETAEFLEGLHPDLLRDVFDLAFPSRVTASRSKNARRIFLNQRLEASGVALQNGGYQLRFGSFHPREYARGPPGNSKTGQRPKTSHSRVSLCA